MFKRLKNSVGKFFDEAFDGNSSASPSAETDRSPEPAAGARPDRPKLVLSRAELKLHSLWGEYTKLGKREQDKQRAAWAQMVPVLCRVVADRPERIDELGEVIEIKLLLGELAKLLINQLKQAELEGGRAVAELLVRMLADQQLVVLQALAGSPAAGRAVCSAGLPSTLVEALAALADMVFNDDEEWDNQAVEAEGRAAALLCRLCGTEPGIKELLSNPRPIGSLFGMVSAASGPGSARVAEHALAALDAVCEHPLTGKQVSYLCEAKCVSDQLGVISPAELPPFSLEFRLTVLQLYARYLAASCTQTRQMLQAFIQAGGFDKLTQLLLWLAGSPGHEQQLELVLQVVSQLVYVGQLPPDQQQQFGNKGAHPNCVQCVEAFRVLPEALKACRSSWLQARILEHMYGVYMNDPQNATLVEIVHPLAAMLVELDSFCPEVRSMIINLLEYQLLVLDHIPHQELGTLAMALQGGGQLSAISRSLIINAIAKWIGCRPTFVHVFREVSLLDSLVHVLSNLPLEDTRTANDVMMLLSLLVRSSSENATLLHSIDAPSHILPRISVAECRAACLELLRNLLLKDSAHTEDYMGALIRELVASGHLQDRAQVPGLRQPANARGQMLGQQADILSTLWAVLHHRTEIRAAFRELGGFQCAISPLGMLKQVFTENEDNVDCARLLLLLLCTLGGALKNDPENANYFRESGAVVDLCDNLSKSGVYTSQHANAVLNGLLQLITDTSPVWQGSKSEKSASLAVDEDEAEQLCDLAACLGTSIEAAEVCVTDIAQSQLVPPLLEAALTHCKDPQLTATICDAVAELLVRARNVKALSELPRFILDFLDWSEPILLNESLVCHKPCVQLLTRLFGSHCDAVDARRLWKILMKPHCPDELFTMLPVTSKRQFSCDVWEFVTGSAHQMEPHCCVALAETAKRTWPPHNFTAIWWLRVVTFRGNNKSGNTGLIHLFHACPYTELASGEPDLVSFVIDCESNTLVATLGDQRGIPERAYFTAFQFEVNTWYHVGVSVQRKSKEKRVALSLIINGQLKQTEHCGLPDDKKRRSWPFLGCPGHHASDDSLAEWQLGPFLFYETPLSVAGMQSLFHLGPSVRGCPLWNAPHLQHHEVILTHSTMMDRIGDNMESNLERYLQLLEQGKWAESVSIGVALVPLMAYHPDMGNSKCYLDSDTWPPIHTRGTDPSTVRNCILERPADFDRTPEFGTLQGCVTMCPIQILSDVMARLGGPSCALLLVESANSSEKLHTALSFITQNFVTGIQNLAAMEACDGFQILGELLKQRCALVSDVVVHRLFEMVGMDQVANIGVMEHVVLDMELWAMLSTELQHLLLGWLSMLAENIHHKVNLVRFKQVNVFEWLIRFCEGSALPPEMINSACTLLRSLLMRPEDLQDHATALYRHTCAMFGTKNFSASLSPDETSERSGPSNRTSLRCALIQVVVQLYSLFSTQESISHVWNACPFRPLLSLCSLEMCPKSVYAVLHGLSQLIQTQPVFLAHFALNNGWSSLRGTLTDPLCANDPMCYRILFACLLGKQLPAESCSATGSLSLIQLCEDNCDISGLQTIELPQVLPVILAMLHTELSGLWSPLARDEERLEASVSLTVLAFITHLHEACPGFRQLIQADLKLMLDFLAMIMYHASDSSFQGIDTQLQEESKPVAELSLISRSMPTLLSWLYLAIEDAMLGRPNAQDVVEGCLGLFEKQEVARSALCGLMTRGLRGLRAIDLSRSQLLVGNMGSVCLLLVNRAKTGLNPSQIIPLLHLLVESLQKILATGRESGSTTLQASPLDDSVLKGLRNAFHSYMVFLLSQAREQGQVFTTEVLKGLCEAAKFVYVKDAVDQNAVISISYWLYSFLMADSTEIRDLSHKMWRHLLVTYVDFMKGFLVATTEDPRHGVPDHSQSLYTDGFDLMLKGSMSDFARWHYENIELVDAFFDSVGVLTLSRQESQSSTRQSRSKGSLEYLRCSELQSIAERLTRAEKLHNEAKREQLQSYEVANALEAGHAQDEWLLYAARPIEVRSSWADLRLTLVHNHGIWPDADWIRLAKWSLDFRVGPQSMRKKMVNTTDHKVLEQLMLDSCKLDDSSIPRHSPALWSPRKGSSLARPMPSPRKSLAMSKSLSQHELGGATIEMDTDNETDNEAGRNSDTTFGDDDEETPLSLMEDQDLEGFMAGSELPKVDLSPVGAAPEATFSPGSHKVRQDSEEPDRRDSEDTVDLRDSQDNLDMLMETSPARIVRMRSESTRKKKMKLISVSKRVKQMLDRDDTIRCCFNCTSIRGLDKVRGILLFGQLSLYVLDHFSVSENGEICEIDEADEGSGFGVDSATGRTRWMYSDIRDFLKRNYLLCATGLEVFRTNGRSMYVVLDSPKERNKVFKQFGKLELPNHVALQVGHEVGKHQSAFTVVKRILNFHKSVTQRWQERDISNFDYLMQLNMIAGRSYNELNCYPVFPWVLADYSSQEIDLQDERAYRDLSKPMGAQMPTRARAFAQRYDGWEDPSGEIPQFHYGSHYSSAGIVLHFLVRLEPFTKFAKQFQGGNFDVADRLFQSIQESWEAASGKNDAANLSDVKELIPEFFYLPDFLVNSNDVKLGTTQYGRVVDDCLLPPWAHGDPLVFIQKNRQALESEYVSLHLHQWIDLIFGYKQLGQAAIDALNVFYHLTYEGAVNIDEVADEVERRALTDQITNFGQTPSQIFEDPHPSRLPRNLQAQALHKAPESVVGKQVSHASYGIGGMKTKDSKVRCCPLHSVMLLPKAETYMSWWRDDGCVTFGLVKEKRKHEFNPIDRLHQGRISALCATRDSKCVVSGGEDTLVHVWDLISDPKKEEPWRLKHRGSLCGHNAMITTVAVSKDFGVVLSGDRDGLVMLWDLVKMRHIRTVCKLKAPIVCCEVHVCTGALLVATEDNLLVWTINGRLLGITEDCISHGGVVRMDVPQITCVAYSCGDDWDEDNVYVSGHVDGSVRFWSISCDERRTISIADDVTGRKMRLRTIKVCNQDIAITALHIPRDETHQALWVGDAQGHVFQFTIPLVDSKG